MFHVTSVLNRESIDAHGLDWSRMGAARGIAGSEMPEIEGCYLCEEWEVEWFATNINNTGGLVDVWAVDGVDADDLVASGSGYSYLPHQVPRAQLMLIRRDIARSSPW